MTHSCDPKKPGHLNEQELTMFGEPLYDATLRFTKVTEYGLSLAVFLVGRLPRRPLVSELTWLLKGLFPGPRSKDTCLGSIICRYGPTDRAATPRKRNAHEFILGLCLGQFGRGLGSGNSRSGDGQIRIKVYAL